MAFFLFNADNVKVEFAQFKSPIQKFTTFGCVFRLEIG